RSHLLGRRAGGRRRGGRRRRSGGGERRWRPAWRRAVKEETAPAPAPHREGGTVVRDGGSLRSTASKARRVKSPVLSL
ncbi:hypothetical protein Nmel_013412, partial [Mimus melanotis]